MADNRRPAFYILDLYSYWLTSADVAAIKAARDGSSTYPEPELDRAYTAIATKRLDRAEYPTEYQIRVDLLVFLDKGEFYHVENISPVYDEFDVSARRGTYVESIGVDPPR